jgi:cysteine desulfurase
MTHKIYIHPLAILLSIFIAIQGTQMGCGSGQKKTPASLSVLRDKLDKAFLSLDEAYLNGAVESRLPHVTNISFKCVEGEGLLMGFNKEIALSSGSACTSASLEPSYVLKALGLGDDLAHSSLRFGLGRYTTEDQIDYTIEQVSKTVLKLREMSPLWEMYKEGVDINSIEWAHH